MGEDSAKTLDEQISDMISMGPAKEEEVVDDLPTEVGEESAVEDEPIEEPSGEEVPDAPEEEVAEERETESEEEEVVEEGTPEEEEPEEPSDEMAEFRDRINKIAEAALRQGVSLPPDLLYLGDDEEAAPAQEPAPQLQEAPPPKPLQVPQGYDDFAILADGVDFDDFLDKPENFVKGMRDILARHEQMITQRLMGSVPSIVSNQVKQVSALQRAVDEFYKTNDDLLPVRSTVGAVADQIVAKHPDWALEKIMDEAATASRKLLKMPSPRAKKGKSKVVRPSFAKSSGPSQRNKPKSNMSKLQSEIDELIE